MKEIEERIYSFALKIVDLVKSMPRNMVSLEMGKQLLRSGTSIAANYEESRGAISRNDFIYKISLCFKESRETNLWLRLIRDSNIFEGKKIEELIKESLEIRNILGKSLKTLREKKNPKS